MGKPIYEPKRVYAQLGDKFIELINSSGLSNEKAEYRCCETYNVKYIIYGVTIKGAAKILGFDTFCPLGT